MSVLLKSEVEKLNDRFRFDAEFLKKEYLTIEEKLTSFNNKRLSEIDYVLIHPTEIKREYVEENGVWFFRTQNIRPLKIEQSNDVFISKQDAEQLKKNLIKRNDIVITRTGANFGQTAIFNTDDIAIGSSHTFILRNNYFNQSYLAVFLNSSFGRKLIDKGMYGGSQPEIAPYYLSNIPIPDFSKLFQTEIEKLITSSYNKIEQSKTLYAQAKQILLQELGFATTPEGLHIGSQKQPLTYDPNRGRTTTNDNISTNISPLQGATSTSIKTFKESYQTSSRLDAEYYQPKYDVLMEKISQFDNLKLVEIATIKKSIEPGSIFYQDKGIPFLRVANISKEGLTETDIYLDATIFTNEDLFPKKDTILLSKDGSIGLAYKVDQDLKVITSSALLHLKVKDTKAILPDYLTLVLNSKVVQLQAERDCGGSIIQHWRMEEIENVVIPILPYNIQTQISTLIQQSFQQRQQSKHLLEVAKQAVEIAIEQNETVALDFIQANS